MYSFIFITLFTATLFAQNLKIEGLYPKNLSTDTNYVKNRSCDLGTKGIAASVGATLTRDTANDLENGYSCKSTSAAFPRNTIISTFKLDKSLEGSQCVAKIKYNSTSVHTLSVYNNGVQLTNAIATLPVVTSPAVSEGKIYFDCKTGSSNVVELYLTSTAAGSINWVEATVSKADFAQSKQAALYGRLVTPLNAACDWPNSSTSFATAAADAGCPVPTAFGNASAPATRIPAITFSNLPAGKYRVVATGQFGFSTNSASQQSQARFSDGTNTTSAQFFALNSSGTDISLGNIVEGVFEYSTDQSNITISLQSRVNLGTVTHGGSVSDFEIAVYYFPSGSDTVVNSKCVNDIACENTFSADVSRTGVVSGENLDWLNGNASISTSSYTLTFNSGIFTNTPNCTATPYRTDIAPVTRISVQSSSSINIFSINFVGGFAIDAEFKIVCQKSGSDFKAKQTIQGFFSNMITGDNNKVMDSFKFAGVTEATVCSSSPCTLYRASSGISSVTRSGVGTYTINFIAGRYLTAPHCTMNIGNGANPLIASGPGSPTTTTYTFGSNIFSGANTDSFGSVICIGDR